MERISLRGMGVALATPFNDDFSVDYEALKGLVEYQVSNGADYLVVLATTSEAVTLSCSERDRWHALWQKQWPGAYRSSLA